MIRCQDLEMRVRNPPWIKLLFVLALMPLPVASAQELPDFSGLYMPGSFAQMQMFPRDDPTYTAWSQALADEFARRYDSVADLPGSHCIPPGMPESMAFPAPFPMEIIQRPQDLTLFFEAHGQYRKIYIDGYPRPEPVLHSRMGYSVGRWEGDTLVVHTSHLTAVTMGRALMSGDAALVERISLEATEDGSRVLVNEMVLSDPQAYREDIVMKGIWRPSPDTPIMEYVCADEKYAEHLQRVEQARSKSAR